MKRTCLFFVVLFYVEMVFAGRPDIELRVYHAYKVNPHSPTIDGRLDDEVWQSAEWQSGFTQSEPDDGAKPSQKTAFKIVYDASNLYVGIRAYDTEPEKIVKRVTRRDQFDGDWVEINIDSYFDHRTAYSFTINAAGVKGDEAISNNGDTWDSNWNAIWFAEVSTDSEGWVAEIKIPFSQLRFNQKEEQVWGIQLQRRLFRKGERSIWQYIPRDAGGWVSYFGQLRGLEDLMSSRRIELLPYGVTDTRRFPKEEGNPFVTGSKNNFSGGLDAKMGLTNNLTIDVTINPDFGQVEADPSEVNLTAFETFFSEKRPFFMEGRSIFESQLMFGDGSFSNDRLFYSRRIGRQPQHSPDLDDGEFSAQPENTSIVGAMKLTGKTEKGWSIGVLDAITEKETAHIDANGVRRLEIAEPLANYFVGRLQKDYSEGNTQIGGMITSVHRDLAGPEVNWMNRAAYSGGLDFKHQWQDKTYTLDIRAAYSQVRGSTEAITSVQESSQRYFQRPDANHFQLDTTRTSLAGHGGVISLFRGGKGHWMGSGGVMWRSPGFEVNDIGFVRQADRVMQWTWVGYRLNHPVSIFRSLNMNFNQWAGWSYGRESLFEGGNINGGGQFKNHWYFWAGVGRETDKLSITALRGGPGVKGTSWWNQWASLSSDDRKSYQYGFNVSNSWADDGGSRRNNVGAFFSLRPINSMRININPSYTFNLNDGQYIETVENVSGLNRYIFSRLNQKTLAVTFRLDYSITPDLSIQYYGQPFVSAGTYTDYKSITEPRAGRYEDRFYRLGPDEARIITGEDGTQLELVRDSAGNINETLDDPNFGFREFRSNLVLRWEYSPGSTLFFVWTQDRSGSDNDSAFSFSRGVDELFEEDVRNVFLIKASRWFSL